MKVNYMISTAAVLAALLTVSCTKDLQENTPVSGKDSDKVTLLIAADEVTKTTFGVNGYEVKWENDDKIGIFIASSSTNVQASLKRIEGKAYFEATVSEYASGDKLCAYYPYADKAGTDASKVTLKIPYIQTQAEANKFNGANNPMIAVPVALPSAENVTDGTVVIPEQLKFRHIGAVLEFDITGVPATEKLKSVQFVSSKGFPATDNSIYDLTSVTENGEVNTVAGTYYKSVTVSLQGDGFTPGQSAKVYMTLVPGTYNGNIYISTDKNLYRYSDKTIDADRAVVKTIKADLSSGRADKSKEIKSALDYEVFAMAANAGDYSAWVDNGEVKLGADISTPTCFTRIEKEWDGIFNGQNYTITRQKSIVPLFTIIEKNGVVKNLKLKGSMTEVRYPDGVGSGSIAKFNYGTISEVESGININIDASSANYMICGMVQLNCGTMDHCCQTGNIDVTYTLDKTRTTYIGGIACFASSSAQSQNEQASLPLGKFINCENTGNITAHKTGAAKVYTAKFSMGGICAIVHQGIPSNFSVFEDCSNTGNISRVDDDQNGSNNFSAVGGIIGRISDAQYDYFKLSNKDNGFYVKINRCNNTGMIENSSYLLNGWTGNNISGARMGATGGIVGYIRGIKDSYAEITDCTSKCTIKGGHAKSSNILGGIAGMSSYTKFSGCTAEVKFNDSSLTGVDLLTGAVGGIVGYVRNNSGITGCSADVEINMPGTIVSECGLCTAGASTSEQAIVVNVSNSKFCGSIAHKGLETPVTVTAENLGDNLVSFGKCNKEGGITYWTK